MPRKKGSSIKTNKKKNLKSVNNARKSFPRQPSPSKPKITQTKSTKGQSTKPKRITKRNCKQDLIINSLV